MRKQEDEHLSKVARIYSLSQYLLSLLCRPNRVSCRAEMEGMWNPDDSEAFCTSSHVDLPVPGFLWAGWEADSGPIGFQNHPLALITCSKGENCHRL